MTHSNKITCVIFSVYVESLVVELPGFQAVDARVCDRHSLLFSILSPPTNPAHPSSTVLTSQWGFWEPKAPAQFSKAETQ